MEATEIATGVGDTQVMIHRIVLLLRKMAEREKYFEGNIFRKIL